MPGSAYRLPSNLTSTMTRAASTPESPVPVGVVGAGYWGPNLVRNFRGYGGTTVRWVCDVSEEKARRSVGSGSDIRITDRYEDLLEDDELTAVAIATPAETHGDLGLAALEAGKHVLMEKPLASSVAEARRLVAMAEASGLVLMCDHTYCYTPAVLKIRELVTSGELGDIRYFDSVRINLGLVQPDCDVLWDLAPHDLSILDFVLPPEHRPNRVSAHVADPLGIGRGSVGYLTMPLPGGAVAHIHVNWLSPTKIRKMIVAGSKKMLVWDDLEPSQRLSIYDRGVEIPDALEDRDRDHILVSYRTGDMVAPALPEIEALRGVVREFAEAINSGRAPSTDGHSGLRIVETLAAAEQSAGSEGAFRSVGSDLE